MITSKCVSAVRNPNLHPFMAPSPFLLMRLSLTGDCVLVRWPVARRFLLSVRCTPRGSASTSERCCQSSKSLLVPARGAWRAHTAAVMRPSVGKFLIV